MSITGSNPIEYIYPMQPELFWTKPKQVLDPSWVRLWECSLTQLPTTSPSWWGSWLPVPKILLSSNRVVTIRDYQNTVDITVQNPPTVTAMDLTPEQISQWVRLEFLYYRTSKGKTTTNKTTSAWFVHPSEVDWGNVAVYPWPIRWWDHNGVAMFRPSWLPVNNQNDPIQLWQMLNGRLAYTDVAYRDTTGTKLPIQALVPIRRKTKYDNNVSSQHYYSPRYAPLYFCCRWAIRNPIDWTWTSWPESKVYTLTNQKHPFRFNPTQSAILWLKCCDINPSYFPLQLQVFAWPSRLSTP